jgi:glycerophosphoryl diester phosphodiesterase
MVDAATAFGCRRVQFPRSVGADDIARAKDNGLVCNLFYSNEPEDAREYLALGIDVILTDRAHALARLFRDGPA